jgi:hypothetical protein
MLTFTNNHWGHGVRDVQCWAPGEIPITSIILASASEVYWDQGRGIFVPFQGQASIEVLNCVPRPDYAYGVFYVRVNILWDRNLLIRVNGVIF